MFAFVGIKDSSYRMKCLLCLPKNTKIMAFQNSPSNLKKNHIAPSQDSLQSWCMLNWHWSATFPHGIGARHISNIFPAMLSSNSVNQGPV
ncbi:hypothetical protein ANANG_G00083700 [Anguilla anguilla]|uniref:Uncharacterized protein n=1 Tax=Anguilla anguilla TaxID=7936 RepID=A0A9D3MNI9_ANGAN|nr:hypothetical protein ANANG_G00083700 [Anguilla anguilla]